MPDIYFIRDQIHTQLLLPCQQLLPLCPQLSYHLEPSNWFRFGWGDDKYFGPSSKSRWLAARALLLPSKSLIDVLALKNPDDNLPPTANLYRIPTSDMALHKLSHFVNKTIKRDKHNKITLIKTGYDNSSFFAANGVYSALNTCNNWTAYALRKAELKLIAPLCMFPSQVEARVKAQGHSLANRLGEAKQKTPN